MSEDFRESLRTVDSLTGKRLWVYADIINSRFWRDRRKIVSWILFFFYLGLPWYTVGGLPFFQADIQSGKLYILGNLFHPNDIGYLVPFIISFIFLVFAISSVAGRVWCGWACPQTVFLEFIYRPIERWVEGAPRERRDLDAAGFSFKKFKIKLTKYFLFGFVSFLVANTFIGLFIGSKGLIQVMTHPPSENWGLFVIMVVVFGLFMFNFSWFREQMCTITCPYGRLQSVLLDRDSLIVGYDSSRGELRGKGRDGDCVDCKKCVQVCPTGIDIRDGLQLECIACTACIDACNIVMEKVNRKPNLIGYTTERKLAKESTPKRVRPYVYFTLFFLLLSFGFLRVANRSNMDVTLLRHSNADFQIENGFVVNHFQFMIQNRSFKNEKIKVHGLEEDMGIVAPQNNILLSADQTVQFEVFTRLLKESFKTGRAFRTLIFENEDGETFKVRLTLFGPEK